MFSAVHKTLRIVLGITFITFQALKGSACSSLEDMFTQDTQGNTSIHLAFESKSHDEISMILDDWFATNRRNATLKNLKGATPLDVAIAHTALDALYRICTYELSFTPGTLIQKNEEYNNFLRVPAPVKQYLTRLIRDLHRKKALKKLPKILGLLESHLETVFVQDNEGNMLLHRAVLEKNYAKLEEILSKGTCAGFRYIKNSDIVNLKGITPLDLAVAMNDHKSIAAICFYELGVTTALQQRDIIEKLCEAAIHQKNGACLRALLTCIPDRFSARLALGVSYVNADTQRSIYPQSTRFHIASCGDQARLAQLLKQSSPNQYRDYRFTPLHAAASAGDATCSALLLRHGADVNFQDANWSTPLHLLVSRYIERRERSELRDEEIEMLYYNTAAVLLAHGASLELENEEHMTPLVAPSQGNWSEIKEKMLRLFLAHAPRSLAMRRVFFPGPRGLGEKSRKTVEDLSFTVCSDTRKVAFSRATDFDSILRGVQTCKIDDKVHMPSESSSSTGEAQEIDKRTFREVVAHSKELNTRTEEGSTLLHYATRLGHVPWVELLLNYGAYPMVMDSEGHTTPLQYAVQLPEPLVRQTLVKLLLDAGASSNVQNKERKMPLLEAAGVYDVACVKMLLASGALVNAAGTDFKTALHAAVCKDLEHTQDTRERQKQVVLLLLEAGASVVQYDAHEVSPLQLLLQNQDFDEGDMQLVELIIASSRARDQFYRAECVQQIQGRNSLQMIALERVKTLLIE